MDSFMLLNLTVLVTQKVFALPFLSFQPPVCGEGSRKGGDVRLHCAELGESPSGFSLSCALGINQEER